MPGQLGTKKSARTAYSSPKHCKSMHFKTLFDRPAWRRHRIATKTVLVMKLTSFFLLAACLQVSARGLSQTVTFSGRNVPLEKVFDEVKKQTGYVFFYDADLLKEA